MADWRGDKVMKTRSLILAATLLAAPLAASAQPVTGLYIGGGAGINWSSATNIVSLSNSALPGNGGGGNLKYNPGFVGLGGVGWGFGNGLRTEVEGDYRFQTFRSVSQSNGPTGNVKGNENIYGVMVNALYDFDVAPWVSPYVGVGVGYQWVQYKSFGIAFNGNFGNQNSQTEGSFAFQAILGAAFPIPDVPGLAITAEFRFLGLPGDRTYNLTGSFPNGTTTANLKVNDEWNYAGLVGLRYNFGVAPPPPPPAPAAAPAPAPTRDYLVFFDWDKYNLDDKAKMVIKDAAENILSGKIQIARIQVNGHTDTTGSAAYNLKLGERRALAVKGELVRLGVKADEIATKSFGFTHLLVPTGPGVREPQNRRAEIILEQ
jgi:outer membrane protein OmpA-like peptidoglycan-associated protein